MSSGLLTFWDALYVEERATFAARVGDELAGRVAPGIRVEVMNAGVSSLNARQEFAYIRERVLAWSPDLIVWGLYANDLVETEADVLFPVRHLGALSFLRECATGRLLVRQLVSTSIGARFGIDAQSPVNRNVEAAWAALDTTLSQADSLLEEQRIPWLVVALPSAIQFDHAWTRTQYQDRLEALCHRHGITYVDTFPSLKHAGTARSLYYFGDLIHPNAYGHAAIASAILTALNSQQMLLPVRSVDSAQ